MSSARSFVREITSVNAGQDKTRNATYIKTNPHGICLQKVVNGQVQESAKVIIAFENENEKKTKKKKKNHKEIRRKKGKNGQRKKSPKVIIVF